MRDSANHALSIAFVGSYASPKIYEKGFYYMRKVRVDGHALTVWNRTMVVAAPANKIFDIRAEAKRLDIWN